MTNSKVHLTYKVLLTIQRQNGEGYMPGGYVYQYMLPARVQPGNSLMQKSLMDRNKDGKGPAMVLYTGN